jgi:hypothetical protein
MRSDVRRSVFVDWFIGSDISPIPLFDAKRQPKTPNHSDRRPNKTFQALDLIGSYAKFPYAAEQRNLAADRGK